MSEVNEMKVIARIHNDFPTKFGIPHQSNRQQIAFHKVIIQATKERKDTARRRNT